MQAIAAFALRGRNQAILSVIGFATLAIFFAPFGLFSAAVIGLVTLVKGSAQGLVITVIASVFMLGISSLTGQMVLGLEYVIFYWLPVWFLARLLASHYSLSLVVMVAAIVGMLAAVVLATMYVSYEAQWNKVVLDNLLPLLKDSNLAKTQQELESIIYDIGRQIISFGAAYWVLSMSASLFIARWWQSLLYHPGGFGEEYRKLRFGIIFSVIALAIVLLAMLIPANALPGLAVKGIAITLLVVFLFQGLAVAHHVVAVRKLRAIWLFMLYVAMMVFMPYEILLIALVGLTDNWANYRLRTKPV